MPRLYTRKINCLYNSGTRLTFKVCAKDDGELPQTIQYENIIFVECNGNLDGKPLYLESSTAIVTNPIL